MQTGAAQGRRLGLRRGADWGYAGAQTGAAQGRRLGLRMGADWGCAGAQTGAAQGRRLGLRRGADWGCAGAQTGAAHELRLGLRRGADWGYAGAQTGAAQGRRLGLRRAVQEGGGGASPQAFGDHPRRRAPHQEVIGARASVCARASTQAFGPALSGGGAPGGRSGWFPPGLAQLCMATGQQRLFPTGLMSVHGPGRMGEGPSSRPRRFLLAIPGGGGGMQFRVFWEASYLPWQNPGGLFALGNLGSGGAEGRSCGCLAGGGAGGGGGEAAPPSPRPVGRPPAFRCPRRAPLGYTRAVGVAGRPRASGAVRAAADVSVRRGGGGGGTPPPWFAAPSSPGRPLIRPLRLCRPWRRRLAVGRQQAGRVGACLGRGAPAPWVQRPLRGGFGAAVSSVCLRPLLGLSGRGGGGQWGGGSGPLAPPPGGRRGGAAWRSLPRGPAIGWGVAPFPRPPLPRAGPSCRPSLGPLIPPAVVARRWPVGGGREG